MAQQSPLETIASLTSAINRGDITAMLENFEPEAVLVVQALADQKGEVARGAGAIRKSYAGFVSLRPALRRVSQQVIESGDTALHFSRWTLVANGPDGSKIERSAVSADVLRKRPDGKWFVLIYNPYGSATLA